MKYKKTDEHGIDFVLYSLEKCNLMGSKVYWNLDILLLSSPLLIPHFKGTWPLKEKLGRYMRKRDQSERFTR